MDFSMLKQAQEIKSKLDQAQKELSNLTVEADSGRGAVRVTMNGQQRVISVKISPQMIEPNKAEQLEELVLKSVNEAIKKSQKLAAKQLKGLTGGLKIPGLT